MSTETTLKNMGNNTPTDIKVCCTVDQSENILTLSRANLEKMSSVIQITDTDETTGLELFCYTKCNPQDSVLVQSCRGIVFNKDEVIMNAFPYTLEYNNTEVDKFRGELEKDFDKCTIFEAHEGTLIRMFYFGSKWFTSTHRKLNAFKSKWASQESFGTAFKKALDAEVENNEKLKAALPDGENILERFQSILDKEKQYMFLVCNSNENRIVCKAPVRPTLFHVGTFVNKELILNEDILIPYPKRHTFSNLDEMCQFICNMDYVTFQGLILFAPDNKQYKIYHKEYQDYFNIRGNEPSIRFRYLQIRLNNLQRRKLYKLYPEMEDVFDDYENCLYSIAQSIHSAYVSRYIKKQYITRPKEEYVVIKNCHGWFLGEKSNGVTSPRVTIEKVIEIMNQQTPSNLNHMIRKMKADEANKDKDKENIPPHISPLLLAKKNYKSQSTESLNSENFELV